MNTKHSSTAPVTDTRPIARTVREMRMEVFTLRVLAAGIVGGAVVAAVWFELPALAFGGLVALWPALSAHWLADLADRTAEALPPKPARIGPRWFMRLYWWLARKQVQRAARPKPWRGVKVDGVEDAIKLPRQPQEMAQTAEPAIVHGYTSSDVYFIACRAATYGLGERATDEYQRRVWTWDDANKISLPSGKHLSRTGFRAVQEWLVAKRLAVSQPYYQLTVTPEVVATELEKE